MSLASLPSEILSFILTFLSPGTVPFSVSRYLHTAAISDRLWWEFFFRRWPRRKLRDGRVPVGRYSPDLADWRDRYVRKLCSTTIEEIFVARPVSNATADALASFSASPPTSSESDNSFSEEEDLGGPPFLKRCYYAGYGRAMAEESRRVSLRPRFFSGDGGGKRRRHSEH